MQRPMFTLAPERVGMNSRTEQIADGGSPHAAADTARGVPYYRLRAYRDALAIVAIAIIIFVILEGIDWPVSLVTWLYQARGWRLDSVTALSLVVAVGSCVFIVRRRNELVREIKQREEI